MNKTSASCLHGEAETVFKSEKKLSHTHYYLRVNNHSGIAGPVSTEPIEPV